MPVSFKRSHVGPLFKGGYATSAKNCRPVSLLPIVSRKLEYFVKQQLTHFLSRHCLLPPSQFAYRKGHSTEDALILATNRWLLAKSERKHTGIVMVDMSKSFDRVDHRQLIQILFEFGLGGELLQWFCSYLSECQQCVKIKDQISTPVPCSRGVPQGSVLGPLLFVLYISDIASVLQREVCNQEFADDIVVDYSNRDPAVVCAVLTTAVTHLSSWLEDKGLQLNSAKTQVMFIRPRGAFDAAPSLVTCNNSVLHTWQHTSVC